MSLRKYQSVEKVKVLPREEQDKISSALHQVGKTSARDLSEQERRQVLDNANQVR